MISWVLLFPNFMTWKYFQTWVQVNTPARSQLYAMVRPKQTSSLLYPVFAKKAGSCSMIWTDWTTQKLMWCIGI